MMCLHHRSCWTITVNYGQASSWICLDFRYWHYIVGAEVPQVREDVRFRLVEPDENMWYVKKNVSEGATDFPVVYRKTADDADIYIVSRGKE